MTDHHPTFKNLASEHGTPLYVMDMERVKENYERLTDALPFCTVKYAAKANNHPKVLDSVKDYVSGAICGSSHEAMDCLEEGFDPSDIQVTAVSPKEESIDHMVELSQLDSSFTVTVNSMDTLRRLGRERFSGQILLRLAPNPAFRKKSKYRKGSLAKFGMPQHEINEAVTYLRSSRMNLLGFHNHLGGSFDTDSMDSYIRHVEDTINRATEWLPLSQIDVINFGGGFDIPRKPDQDGLDLDILASNLEDVLPLDTDTEFVIEPGRYIVGDAGSLLTRVMTVKETQYGRFVGVDAGMSEFPRPMMFDAYHHMDVLGDPKLPSRPNMEQTVAGPTCSGADIFASDRLFSKARIEDLIVIEDVGAYGLVMANQFHSYPIPELVTIGE